MKTITRKLNKYKRSSLYREQTNANALFALIMGLFVLTGFLN